MFLETYRVNETNFLELKDLLKLHTRQDTLKLQIVVVTKKCLKPIMKKVFPL